MSEAYSQNLPFLRLERVYQHTASVNLRLSQEPSEEREATIPAFFLGFS